MSLEKYNKKSFGGFCKEYIELFKPAAARESLIANGKYAVPIIDDDFVENFYFIKGSATFNETPVIVDGAEMYKSEITMLIAGDDESRIRELERIKRKKWLIRFEDASHDKKIIGHPDGQYASMMIVSREGKNQRSDRREIAVIWTATLPEPVAVYRW
jgi:hypothetical protein